MTFSIDEYDKWKEQKLDKIAERGKELLKAYIRAKPHYVSGNLYESVTTMPGGENSRRILTDPESHTNGIKYGPIVRDGRGPVPRDPNYWKGREHPKSLRWFKNGEPVFSKRAGPYDGDPNLPGKPGHTSPITEQLRKEIPNL